MQTRTKAVIAGAAIAAAAAGAGVGIAGADNGPDDDATDRPIPAAELDRASAAALDATGGGRVTETEVDDEESWYEVEVTLDDGSQVDVQLDRNFNVVSSSADHED
jgi:uncharacterized membrane protein YkoI